MAKEEKRQERAVMRPPDTAVSLVDLWRHRDTDSGDNIRDTQVHSGDNQSGKKSFRLCETSVSYLSAICLLIFDINL